MPGGCIIYPPGQPSDANPFPGSPVDVPSMVQDMIGQRMPRMPGPQS